MTDNPFFESWTTPFGLLPFDRIRAEHFPPAFDRGMAEEAAEIEAIVCPAGDTRDPMDLYVAFRGREPRIEALMKHRGLADDDVT